MKLVMVALIIILPFLLIDHIDDSDADEGDDLNCHIYNEIRCSHGELAFLARLQAAWRQGRNNHIGHLGLSVGLYMLAEMVRTHELFVAAWALKSLLASVRAPMPLQLI